MMGRYEFELKGQITDKAVELRRLDGASQPCFIAPISVLNVVSERVVWGTPVNGRPAALARFLVVEMPDWKAQREGIPEQGQHPATNADGAIERWRARDGLSIQVNAWACDMTMGEYLALFGLMESQAV